MNQSSNDTHQNNNKNNNTHQNHAGATKHPPSNHATTFNSLDENVDLDDNDEPPLVPSNKSDHNNHNIGNNFLSCHS